MWRGHHQSKFDHFFHRKTHRQSSVHFHSLKFGGFSVFGKRPELFQNFIKLFLIRHGKHFLGGDFAVVQFDAAVGQAGDDGIVRDHDDGASLLVKFAQ